MSAFSLLPRRINTMRYTRFEDLPVWNSAIDLAVNIYAFTDRSQLRRVRSLRNQIERAALSVSNNIADGFERGTNKELLAFLYIARGSAGDLRSDTKTLKVMAESCSRQLKAWAQSLQT